MIVKISITVLNDSSLHALRSNLNSPTNGAPAPPNNNNTIRRLGTLSQGNPVATFLEPTSSDSRSISPKRFSVAVISSVPKRNFKSHPFSQLVSGGFLYPLSLAPLTIFFGNNTTTSPT